MSNTDQVILSFFWLVIMANFAFCIFMHRSIQSLWQYLKEKSERDYELQKSLYGSLSRDLDALEKKVKEKL